MAGFLGCGTLYGALIVQGVVGGLEELGNATKAEIKANGELKQNISNECGTYGQAADSVFIAAPSDISVDLTDLRKKSLAAIFLGQPTDSSAVASVVASESSTVANTLPTLVTLNSRNIANLVVKDVTDVTTHVLGTDYRIISAELGIIEILAGGGISAGDVIHSGYDSGASTGTNIIANTQSDIKMKFVLIGKNKANGKAFKLVVYNATIKPSSFDFLAKEFAKLELSGTVNIDEVTGQTFTVDLDIVAM